MANQKFLVRSAGETKQATSVSTSAGAADAGKIPALDAAGKLDPSMMPSGIGSSVQTIVAFEALSGGAFVNLFVDSGVFKARLADNSNGRPADGFVSAAFSVGESASVYPMDAINAGLSGLTAGSKYWLGTAGGVIDTPLDETSAANVNKISQYLGKAKSATELLTNDDGYVVL